MRTFWAMLLACLLLLSGGAGAMTTYTIKVGGVARTYHLDLPNGYSNSSRRTYPVVILLHGGQGDGPRVAAQTGMSAQARVRGVIAVYPDALPSAGGTQWNDGRPETNLAGHDDVAFLTALADTVVSKWGRDKNRVYLAGTSSGGMMTLRMMCERTTKFHAYGVVIANMPVGLACHPAGSVAAAFFASTTDPLMPFNGGAIAGTGERGTVTSSADTVAFWAADSGCGPQPVAVRLPVLVNDGTAIDLVRWETCKLDYYQVVGGGHAWPGGLVDARFGITTQNLNATATLLQFFGL